ncbi:Rqc2 family fibronectin-binding protein [Listeria fleischmannii]|jgi:predicted ribosome quality control (RQC) complex YloA/Tae2 family protein|uniref:Rqc2 homolog RqcH n=1 Tax=Listeria fleischmannii TaxID=1069827 RepID=A0A841YEV6_9LIST|nr:NFACT RNA binding domain-containing protein [Listeria fleischmannii]EIA19210.1 fibronectin/fibrinogen-binding protein [Listeria fleischmannii subsp. coloradonensis]MBC1398801.1 fibronectin/fibrinogen-binding protein [Listeria fleischmannii]MBC1427054.1 fibronectin/fibrinogen-binding protein [Listeria fleischmannii]STY34152.1 Fibronectin-binding protein A N-terminus (FbpA) [Listeria fleischmannii subsp. coloradonensis]
MAFDAMFLKSMTEEIKEGAESGRIMKIHQPFPHELILFIRKNRENKRLLISAHPSYARVQWTTDVPENPANPPMFCMLLRKHLEGAIIEEVRQEPNERILVLGIRGKDDIGENRFLDLYIEIMGRHSNLTLVDRAKGTIIDCIKHISPAQNSYRTLLPGAAYILPPKADKQDPFSISASDFERLFRDEENPAKRLVKEFAGFSPLLAAEIVGRANETDTSSLQNAFFDCLHEIPSFLGEKAVPHTFTRADKEDYYFMPLTFRDDFKKYSSLSELLDAFYIGKARRDRVHQMGHDLERQLATERTRNVLKIEKLEHTLLETEKADEFRTKGELLTANLYKMEKGMESVTVQDFYDEALPDITIPLDTRKTPSQNAQYYFTRYQKLRNAVAYVNEQIALTQEEITYLDGILAQLETAGPSDVEEIRQELAEQGYIRYKKPKNGRQKNAQPKLEKYTSTSGLPILVGKNNKQNEYLTNKLAKNNELWFHVKDLPGSHVVIQDPNPDEVSITEAAMIAAYFSKARLSSTVPVDATLIKHVKKPNGAKPGYVIYDNQTTYFVTPDEEKVQALKN